MTDEDLKDKIRKIEADLIEQEHRPIKVISNFLFRKKRWPKGDARRISSTKSLIWRLFFSPGTIAASGGIIAIATLFVFLQQNKIIQDQNSLITKQNESLINQLRLETKFELERNLFDKNYNESKRRLDILSYMQFLKESGQEQVIEGIEVSGGKYDSVRLVNCYFNEQSIYHIKNSYIISPKFKSFENSITNAKENAVKILNGHFSSIRNSTIYNLYKGRIDSTKLGYGLIIADLVHNDLVYDSPAELNLPDYIYKELAKGSLFGKGNYLFSIPSIDSSNVKIEKNTGMIYYNTISNSNIILKRNFFYGVDFGDSSFPSELKNDTIFAANLSKFNIGESVFKDNVFILNNIDSISIKKFKFIGTNKFHFRGDNIDTIDFYIEKPAIDLNGGNKILFSSEKNIIINLILSDNIKYSVNRISDTQININSDIYKCVTNVNFNQISYRD